MNTADSLSAADRAVVSQFEALLQAVMVHDHDPTSLTANYVPNPTSTYSVAPPGYEIAEKAGEGGMGAVYRARDIRLNRTVALKMISSSLRAEPRELARFRFEAEAAAGLQHDNIVTVYEFGETNGIPYLSLEWMEGGTLGSRMPTAPKDIATMMTKVARAVHHAHERGILHRDLKPANILLDQNGEPHVADFGIARRLGADATVTQTGGLIGTPAYMSPEQARGETLTFASDVYSLGAVMYELLTRRKPFTGTIAEVLTQVQSESAPPEPHRIQPNIDADLEAVCLKCLRKEPGKRYTSAASLADDLERYLRGEGVEARPPGLWDWLQQIIRTRPDPDIEYSWEVPAWYGAIFLATNVGLYLLVQAEYPTAWVWFVNAGAVLLYSLTLWWYMLRRFGHLPETEKHSVIIAAGNVACYIATTAAYVPFSFLVPARAALGIYPALAATSGMALFTLGSTNWSLFFPIGAATIALAPLMAYWPNMSPLLFGAWMAVIMWFWAYIKKGNFGIRS